MRDVCKRLENVMRRNKENKLKNKCVENKNCKRGELNRNLKKCKEKKKRNVNSRKKN